MSPAGGGWGWNRRWLLILICLGQGVESAKKFIIFMHGGKPIKQSWL